MGTFSIIVVDVLPGDVAKVIFAKDDEMVEAFVLERLHPAFSKGIEVRGETWKALRLDACGAEDVAEMFSELGIHIMDEVGSRKTEFSQMAAEVTSLLSHPCIVGVGRETGDEDLPGAYIDEEEDEVIYKAMYGKDFFRDEITGPERVSMDFEELIPGSLAACRTGVEAVSKQDVVDGGTGDTAAELAEFAEDS